MYKNKTYLIAAVSGYEIPGKNRFDKMNQINALKSELPPGRYYLVECKGEVLIEQHTTPSVVEEQPVD